MADANTHTTPPPQPRRTESTNSSDKGEDFQDAHDMTPRPPSHADRSRTRSLLSRRTSSSSTAQEPRADSPVPEIPNRDGSEEEKEKPKEKEVPNGTPEAAEMAPQTGDDAAQSKSPLLTAHRISVTSMDDVSLEEGGAKSTDLLPKLPSRDSASGLQGLSGKMSPVKFPPPPVAPPAAEKEKHTSLPTPTAPTRKLTSPFSWLSRNSSSKKQPESPPLSSSDRRNTTSSLATIGSNPDMALANIDEDGQTKRASTGSLRDRFKILRMREEAGITLDEDAERAGLGLGIMSPTAADNEHAAAITSGPTSPKPASLIRQSTVNPSLAPGTAAGFAAGPAGDTAEPVDWDLWQNVVNEGPAAVVRTSAEELNRAIANGIPQAIRGVIWQVLSQSKNEELENTYRELVVRGTDKEQAIAKTPLIPNGDGKEKDSVTSSSSSVHSDYSTPATTNGSTNAALPSPSISSEKAEDFAKMQAKLGVDRGGRTKQETVAIQKLEKVIKRDLGARTSYSKYLMAAGLQDGLFGICKAYALYDEAVGYAQGMNFIAMPLLFNMPEEEAFSLFVALMNKYKLRDLFVQDMPGLHLHLYQFERLLEDFEPALYCHLRRKDVKPQLYATQWFLTLFAYRFPLQLVLRIYDLILSDGLEGAILKFGIVLMQKNARALLGMKDMSTLTTFLKERIFDAYIDKAPSSSSILESGFFGSTSGVDKEVYRADQLVKDAVSVPITPQMLQQYTTEWREQQRVEKEREAELQGYKDKSAMLEKKVRGLESRCEQSDAEHVQVVSELVKTKVENDSLSEENETLKTKVEGLQKIVDTQVEEVEARMKGEMEEVMAKNIVVHNENRALEENMAEMEKELVSTKMQWATINEEYEQLKQKWNNMAQMMKM
ncbi:GTPase-activating protein-like protein GYP5 [Byssothecium circinans]|uniref:GTPase-activating protein GYP5 n=1 Tax=Byssothecium circinans TaxID=147558 RepID=A0A6A5TG19_9PLEO|nr:GTPase-activating protein-like protein GYP5 [Byssothecium circinans]